jgi:hypothetical protein
VQAGAGARRQRFRGGFLKKIRRILGGDHPDAGSRN